MSPFHLAVFKCKQISLFLDNFDKIRNLDPEQDKIYILDCSSNHKQEQEKVAKFVQEKGWEFNKEVDFIILEKIGGGPRR